MTQLLQAPVQPVSLLVAKRQHLGLILITGSSTCSAVASCAHNSRHTYSLHLLAPLQLAPTTCALLLPLPCLRCHLPCFAPGSGIYHVTCSSTGSLPSGFTVKLSAVAGAAGCTDSGEDTTTVSADCCTTGSSCVRGEGALSTGATSKSYCFSQPASLMPCGNSNWGWRNQLGGEGIGTFDMYEGGGNDCGNLNKKVGNLTISCANSNGAALVTLFKPQQSLVPATSGLDQHFYVGCAFWLTTSNTKERSPTCSPPRYAKPQPA